MNKEFFEKQVSRSEQKMKVMTFISIYTLRNVSNNFMIQKIKDRFKRFRSQQTNIQRKKQQSFILTAHYYYIDSTSILIQILYMRSIQESI